MTEKKTKRPLRAVRNIESASFSQNSGGSPPYSYRRETKQEAAARIERELRQAAGMTPEEHVPDGGDTVTFDPGNPPSGDTKVFTTIGADRPRRVVISPDASDVEAAQREINEALMRRSQKKRRIAKTVLIICAALAVVALIVIIAAGLGR